MNAPSIAKKSCTTDGPCTSANSTRKTDFVCLREGEVLYVQVADSIADESTRERELSSLRSIADNHPKWIVVRQGSYPPDVDGTRIVRAADFFLE